MTAAAGTSDIAHTLSATDAAARIRTGRLSAGDLVTACLDRIAASDDQVRAWRHLDGAAARARAEELDDLRRRGRPLGPLHGIPVGLKDIVDTTELACEYGSPIHAGRRPDRDAALVERLREAGAVILGKTVTTEFAFLHAGETRNPHDPARTPGGSSSGSAAAVAAHQVPLAIGSQTNGSTIRPASFCGVYGFKPSRGIVPRRGVLETSSSLDQIGVFARSLQDAALLADVIGFYDPTDRLSYPRARPRMAAGAAAEPPVEPHFAWFDLPFNDRLEPAARAGLDEIVDLLGSRIERIPAPKSFAAVVESQRIVHEVEMARALGEEIERHWDRLSETIRPRLKRGMETSEDQYREAHGMIAAAEDYFEQFFADYDAVLTPSAAGEAPGADSTGDPVFCTIWTFAGLPALSIPLLVGECGLPIGVQLVGGREQDDRLMRTAAWLVRHLNDNGAASPGAQDMRS